MTCNCSMDLPPGAYCSICGRIGMSVTAAIPRPPYFVSAAPLLNEARIFFSATPLLNEGRVRQIVLEELERMAKK